MHDSLDLVNGTVMYRLEGQIVDGATSLGIDGVFVDLTDAEDICHDLVAHAKTNPHGEFSVAIEASYYHSLFLDRQPALVFRLFKDGQFPAPTARWQPTLTTSHIRIAVDTRARRTREDAAPSVVRGRITQPNGAPLAQLRVVALDTAMNAGVAPGTAALVEVALGEATSDAQGRYRIEYVTSDLAHPASLHAALIVRALNAQNTTVAETPRLCHAPTTAVIDMVAGNVAYRGPSEYERVSSAVQAVVNAATIAALTEDQIAYIACRTGERQELVETLVKANGLVAEINVDVVALYGILRQGFPSVRRQLLAVRLSQIRNALERSVNANIVPLMSTTQIDDVIAEIKERIIDMLFEPHVVGGGSLGGILALAVDTESAQREFVRLVVEDEGTVDQFWTTVASHTPFAGAGTVDRLKRTLQWGALSRYHIPLAQELERRFQAAEMTSLQDLAKLDFTDWRALLDTSVGTVLIGAPFDIPGSSDSEKRDNYARILERTVETAFPTAVITDRMRRVEGTSSDAFKFLNTNAAFDFKKQRVAVYLAENPTAMTAVTDVNATTARLKGLERVFRLTPRYTDEMKKLLDAGIDSSQRIHKMGKHRFVQQFGGSEMLGAARAEHIYDRACWVAGAAAALFGKFSAKLNNVGVYALPDLGKGAETPHPKAAEWATLFGSLSACKCEDCQSVYGPAAYLVDVLEFLDRYDSSVETADSTPANRRYFSLRDALIGDFQNRPNAPVPCRPDIARIALSCKNTNTTLPYIDLVNEVLEAVVANIADEPDHALPNKFETVGTADELLAEPEIPEDHEPARHGAYVELGKAVHPFDLPWEFWAEEARAYLEHLGVPRHELLETFIGTTDPQPAEIADKITRERLRLSRPAWKIVTNQVVNPPTTQAYWGMSGVLNWTDELKKVPRFLKQSGLTFDELRELLDTVYVNGDNGQGVNGTMVELQPSEGCNIDVKELVGLTNTNLERIHRFLRLRLRAGLSITEMDRITSTFGVTDTSDVLVRHVADILALKEKLDLPLPVLLSFWGPLGTKSTEWGKSLYEEVFLNRAVTAQSDQFAKVLTNSASGSLLDHKSGILVALRLNDLEFALLMSTTVAQAVLGLAPIVAANEPLNLDNLSRLYRVVALARVVKLPLHEFLMLRALSGINTLSGDDAMNATPAATRWFVKLVQQVQQSALSVTELHYLARHVLPPGSSVGMPHETAASLVAELESTVVGIKADADASAAAGNPVDLQTLHARYDDAIHEKLASVWSIDASVIDYLLAQVLKSPLPSTNAAILEFYDVPKATTVQNRKTTLLRLDKLALIIERLGLGRTEWELTYPESGQTDWLDLNEYSPPLAPVDDGAAYRPQFQRLVRFIDLATLRDVMPDKAETLRGIGDAIEDLKTNQITEAQFFDAIAELTDWPRDDVEFLMMHGFGYAGLPPNQCDCLEERAYLCLYRAIEVLKRMGAKATQVSIWSNIDPPVAQVPGELPDVENDAAEVSLDIKRVTRAHYDVSQWADAARPLRDVLREKQRDALVHYLVSKNDLDGSNALFEKHLIDVEMSACQLTSRIKMAIGSVQTFVQRLLMGLEPSVGVLGEEAAREWSWMKNYRVWEANRKIFLYPENWIEPELRDDKTPFFRTLESRLLQGEITAEAVGSAYQEYLEELHAVARLEVAAICREYDSNDDPPLDIVHVIARTQGAPHRYYYRKRIDSTYWTPWEKVDVEIQGDHLLATVWNRRLYLFWPVFEEGANTENPKAKFRMRLAWTSRSSEKFANVRMSDGDTFDVSGSVLSRESISLATSADAGRLSIDVFAYFRPMGIPGYAWSRSFVLDPCTGEMALVDKTPAFFPGWWPVNAEPKRMRLVEIGEKQDGTPWSDYLRLPYEKGPGSSTPINLLTNTPGRFDVLIDRTQTNVRAGNGLRDMLMYRDRDRTFFIDRNEQTEVAWNDAAKAHPNVRAPIGVDAGVGLEPVLQQWDNAQVQFVEDYIHIQRFYRFHTFYHPYVCEYTRTLARDGIDGLLRWSLQAGNPLQLMVDDTFESTYQPTSYVDQPYPIENVDFSFGGAYSQYNWELFFHAPLLVATRLTQNSRFEDADRWYRYIFDPTGGAPGTGPERFWYVKPFRENLDLASIQEQLEQLAQQNPEAKQIEELLNAEFDSPLTQDLVAQIAAWRKTPFNPHLIARMRPIAYQKNVVMRYIANLLEWGDSMFRRETIESINEATQLYILAQNILGDRPLLIKTKDVTPKTYAELEATIDAFSNALVEIESIVPPPPNPNAPVAWPEPPPVMRLYFCVPPNDKMLGLWDTVEDRLWKIRHCRDIEGNVRQLPLFEPPIDPALLVRAAAAGVDIGTLLLELNAPLPLYRFSVLLPKAVEFTNGVIAMGNTLLSILEKRDGEALAKLRATQEVTLLTSIRNVRQRQIDEAKETIEGLRKSRAVVEERLRHYAEIKDRIPEEWEHQRLSDAAATKTNAAQENHLVASVLRLIPQFDFGTGGMSTQFGGVQLGGVMEAFAQYNTMRASEFGTDASKAATEGTYKRRAEEWVLQKELATRELAQIDRQILGAEIRLDIANKELQNHELSLANATDVEKFLSTKYTNEKLYVWMLERVKTAYFQGYKLAYDLAKRAERAFQFELADDAASFINAANWDSAQQGLMAGETLLHDLRCMDAAYLEQNKREYEITKHVSLAEVDPKALLKLRETGTCEVTLAESLFDQDWPGHYMRRIKTVALTVPVTNAPYGSVNCKLAITHNEVRVDDRTIANVSSVRTDYTRTESIVTSTGQQDSGTFELVFRDERYLPFEGAGADSEWDITLKKEGNRFDPTTIHDVVMHLRYTARHKGATASAASSVTGYRLFSARADFPDAWELFTKPPANATETTLSLPFALRHFQSLAGTTNLEIDKIHLFTKRRTNSNAITAYVRVPGVPLDQPASANPSLTKAGNYGAMFYALDVGVGNVAILEEIAANFGVWTITIASANFDLEDIWLICEYKAQ